MSSYEEKIIKILKKDRIKFEREKTFSDLSRGHLRFDFEIYAPGGRVLCEVNGEQHYRRVNKFQKTYSEFLAQQERDRKKISYCLARNIPLYVIPFWELDSINSSTDLFNPKYLARNRWKNDKDWKNFRNKK